MKHHLKQEVAQLLAHVLGVIGLQGLQGLIGFLNEVGAQRDVGLLLIPWAAARTAEVMDDLLEAGQAVRVIGDGKRHGKRMTLAEPQCPAP